MTLLRGAFFSMHQERGEFCAPKLSDKSCCVGSSVPMI
jgi:hypothetical protein